MRALFYLTIKSTLKGQQGGTHRFRSMFFALVQFIRAGCIPLHLNETEGKENYSLHIVFRVSFVFKCKFKGEKQGNKETACSPSFSLKRAVWLFLNAKFTQLTLFLRNFKLITTHPANKTLEPHLNEVERRGTAVTMKSWV